MKIGRNDPCHCGSGQKYKKCHLPKEEASHAAELAAKAAAQAAELAAQAAKASGADEPEAAPEAESAVSAPSVAATATVRHEAPRTRPKTGAGGPPPLFRRRAV